MPAAKAYSTLPPRVSCSIGSQQNETFKQALSLVSVLKIPFRVFSSADKNLFVSPCSSLARLFEMTLLQPDLTPAHTSQSPGLSTLSHSKQTTYPPTSENLQRPAAMNESGDDTYVRRRSSPTHLGPPNRFPRPSAPRRPAIPSSPLHLSRKNQNGRNKPEKWSFSQIRHP
jgi:hypothetical protein